MPKVQLFFIDQNPWLFSLFRDNLERKCDHKKEMHFFRLPSEFEYLFEEQPQNNK